MKLLLFVLLPVLTQAATIATTSTCTVAGVSTTTAGPCSAVSTPVNAADTPASATTSISWSPTLSGNQLSISGIGMARATPGNISASQTPVPAASNLSSTFTIHVTTTGSGSGFVEVLGSIAFSSAGGGTSDGGYGLTSVPTVNCLGSNISCVSVPVFLPVELGTILTFTAIGDSKAAGSSTQSGSQFTLNGEFLFFGPDQTTPVGISEVVVPEPSITSLLLLSALIAGGRFSRKLSKTA